MTVGDWYYPRFIQPRQLDNRDTRGLSHIYLDKYLYASDLSDNYQAKSIKTKVLLRLSLCEKFFLMYSATSKGDHFVWEYAGRVEVRDTTELRDHLSLLRERKDGTLFLECTKASNRGDIIKVGGVVRVLR